MGKLIIIRGPLGVGKTTIAKKLAEQLHARYFSIDETLRDHGLDKEENIPFANFLHANELLLPAIQESLKTQPVIVDGNFYYPEQIAYFQSRFPESLKIFTLEAPLNTCIERDANRDRSYGRGAVEYLYMMVCRFVVGERVNTDDRNAEGVANEIVSKLE